MVIPLTTQIAFKDGVLDIAKIRPGNYSVIITLTDSNAYNPGVSVYTLYLQHSTALKPLTNITTITNATVNTTASTVDPPYFSKVTINSVGLC
jgi:hypothetical protein